MVDQEAAEKQAATELVAAIKAISVRQAEIAGLLRDMIQIALPALHACSSGTCAMRWSSSVSRWCS